MSLLTVLASLWPLGRFIAVALERVRYPFDLEWCEGAIIAHIRIILQGHQPYQAPSFELTSYIYPPLYYYVSALPARFLGAGHLAPRLVSLLSILGCFLLLARSVYDETGDLVAATAAAGLLSATYQLTGFWFEIARVDAFFLFLVLASHRAARRASSERHAVYVGILLAAACFTKQLGVPLAVPALATLSLRSLRLGSIAASVSGGLVLLSAFAFNVASHGWFFFYVVTLPSRHAIEWERFWPSLASFFFGPSLLLTLAGLASLCGLGLRRNAWHEWLYYALLIAIACSSSFLPFLKSGGYPNGLIPAYAALALAAGLQLAAMRRAAIGSALGTVGPPLLSCLALIVQVVLLRYDPKQALPSRADLDANRTVVARLNALPKPLFVTGSSFYTMAGGGPRVFTDTMAMIDILKGGGYEATRMDELLTGAIRSHRFRTIVTDRVAGFLPDHYQDLIRENYRQTGSVLDGLPGDVIWPKTGASLRPDTIWEAPE